MDSVQNLQDLFTWIDSHTITRQKKNLNRDFSDAVPLAEILKQHFPRFVDLHNYAPKNSVSKKMENWFTLNRKVLSKLDINLTQTEMLRLSKSEPGAVEELLFKIKRKVNEYEKEEHIKTKADASKGDVTSTEKNSEKVPLELLEKQALELDIKNEAIQILNNKVMHLQALLEVKDQNIQELQQKLNQYITKENSSFFNRLLK